MSRDFFTGRFLRAAAKCPEHGQQGEHDIARGDGFHRRLNYRRRHRALRALRRASTRTVVAGFHAQTTAESAAASSAATVAISIKIFITFQSLATAATTGAADGQLAGPDTSGRMGRAVCNRRLLDCGTVRSQSGRRCDGNAGRRTCLRCRLCTFRSTIVAGASRKKQESNEQGEGDKNADKAGSARCWVVFACHDNLL